MTIITRFAPSPTNNIHCGHVYSARLARDMAHGKGGQFIIRIEDIDHTRCRDEFTTQILDDLAWLGIQADQVVRHQSQHLSDYQDVLNCLDEMGVIYPCFCTNAEIRAEIERAGQAPHEGEHQLYPGTCRDMSVNDRATKIAQGVPYALRLDMNKACELVGHFTTPLTWYDGFKGTVVATPEKFGDIVIARKDIGTSYHISVVNDDALQGVTDVVRGGDLFDTTHIHCLLQTLLDYDTPRYHHHGLLCDPKTGRRLAKRDHATTITKMREAGQTPQDVMALVDQYAGISSSGL